MALTGSDVVNIVGGLVQGIIQKDDLSILQQCMQNAETLTTEIEVAVADFEKGGLEGYAQGLMEVSKIFKEIPQDLANCQAMGSDLTKLEEWAKIFLTPTTLIKVVSGNLIWHYKEITTDISNAVADYNAAKYFEFGEQLGEALVVATKQ